MSDQIWQDHLDPLTLALRDELIQVAAVAISAVEDVSYGSSLSDLSWQRRSGLWEEIMEERRRQDEKWGNQHHDPRAWLTILGEEFGEACQAALRIKHEGVRMADLGML